MREGPIIPGLNRRFINLDPNPDEEVIRNGVQWGGPHLYVFGLPFTVGGTRPKCVVEAYEPWEISDAYFRLHIDPFRAADFSDGRLVAIKTVPLKGTFKVGAGRGSVDAFFNLTPQMVREIRRNNRNSRSELRRSTTAQQRKQALANAQEAEDEPVFKEWEDWFVDAYRETEKFAMGTVRVPVDGVST